MFNICVIITQNHLTPSTRYSNLETLGHIKDRTGNVVSGVCYPKSMFRWIFQTFGILASEIPENFEITCGFSENQVVSF